MLSLFSLKILHISFFIFSVSLDVLLHVARPSSLYSPMFIPNFFNMQHGMKNWKIVTGICYRKCAEFSPEEMRPYKREFQYQGCKL